MGLLNSVKTSKKHLTKNKFSVIIYIYLVTKNN